MYLESVFLGTQIFWQKMGKWKNVFLVYFFASQTCNEEKLNITTSQQPIDHIIFMKQRAINDLYVIESGTETIFDIS